MVAHERDEFEAGGQRTLRHRADEAGEDIRRHGHRARKAHMRGLCRGIAGDGKGNDGIDQRVAELVGNLLGAIARNEVVLADRHVRAVLLAADRKSVV